MAEQTHYRACHLCEAMCGVEIRHENGRVLSIRGDADDPLSRGHICPKAVAIQDLQEDPDRLRQPMKRTAQGWQEISWEQALSEAAAGIRKVQKQQGRNAVGMYIGNPTAHNHGALMFLPFLFGALRTHNRYSATSVDQLPQQLAAYKMFGNQALFPIPDLERTDYWLILGGNPMASNGSLMTAPDMRGRIRDIRKRGGRVVVVDPRLTETAKVASEHHFIRPGGDAYLLLGFLHVLYREGRANAGRLHQHVDGLATLGELVSDWTPARVAPFTGMTADAIELLAADIMAAPSAAFYGRVGLCTSPNSTLAAWLLYALNVVAGHFDEPGGAMFTHPALDAAALMELTGEQGSFDTRRSRVRGLPEFFGEYPAVTLADEILTPGEGQVRAMVTHAGNPVLSVPDGGRMDEAFASLDFMVSIDIYINETTRHANLILPPVGPLERGQFDPIFHGVAIRNTIRYAPAMIEPEPGALRDWEIMLELSTRIMATNPATRLAARMTRKAFRRLGDEGLIDLALRTGPYGTPGETVRRVDRLVAGIPGAGRIWQRLRARLLENAGVASTLATPWLDAQIDAAEGLTLARVQAHPHGIDLGPLRPSMPGRLATRGKRIQLVPEMYRTGLRDLPVEAPVQDGLLMIGRRHVRSNNSWMHNSHRLVKGKPRCTVMLHPQDALRLGITQGDTVEVSSPAGRIELPAEVTDEIMPGVVSVPHGWGHQRKGVELRVACKTPGVSMNDVIGTNLHDPLTGTAIINGVPVALRKVEVPVSVVEEQEAVTA